MKDTEVILRELCAASSRLQEVEYLAKKAGQSALADEARRAGTIVADAIGKLITRNMTPAEAAS